MQILKEKYYYKIKKKLKQFNLKMFIKYGKIENLNKNIF